MIHKYSVRMNEIQTIYYLSSSGKRNLKTMEVKNMLHKNSNWLKSGLIPVVNNQKKLACILVPEIFGGDGV